MRGEEMSVLKPGRELDTLVAEKVYLEEYKKFQQEPWGVPVINFIPHFSTSIEDAWKIVEKLNPDVFEVVYEHGFYYANFNRVNSSMYVETPAHAICLAALKAVENEK